MKSFAKPDLHRREPRSARVALSGRDTGDFRCAARQASRTIRAVRSRNHGATADPCAFLRPRGSGHRRADARDHRLRATAAPPAIPRACAGHRRPDRPGAAGFRHRRQGRPPLPGRAVSRDRSPPRVRLLAKAACRAPPRRRPGRRLPVRRHAAPGPDHSAPPRASHAVEGPPRQRTGSGRSWIASWPGRLSAKPARRSASRAGAGNATAMRSRASSRRSCPDTARTARDETARNDPPYLTSPTVAAPRFGR